jgi:hypothetical protein
MKRLLMMMMVLLMAITITYSQYVVKSPDSFSTANIEIGEQISYSVLYEGKTVISESAIRFEFLQAPLITVNSWNELTETSYLRPCTMFGYGYLEAIKKVFLND